MIFFNSILFAKYSRARGNQKYEIRFKTPIRKNHEKKKNKLLKNYLKTREQGGIEIDRFCSKPQLRKNTKKRKLIIN